MDASIWRRLHRGALAALGLVAALWPAATAAEEPALATPWVSEHATRARLVAGGLAPGGPRLLAGVELELDDGWKTYWRNPGSSGVPPRIDFAGSENLAAADMLFPAPERFKERDGDTIGYKKHVVLPILVTAADPARPVKLKIAFEYGVCREVCVPVQPELVLELPPDTRARPSGAALAEAIGRVPRKAAERRERDPKLEALKVVLTGDKPHVAIEATFPDARGSDVFLEAPDGLWMPLAIAAGEATGGRRRFHVDLTDGADVPSLKGRDIRLTLVSAGGATDATFRMPE